MNKSEISTIELMTHIFVAKAFRIAGKEHPELKDELDLLPYACKILRETNDRIKIALQRGDRNSQELREIDKLFRFIEGIQEDCIK